MFWSNRVQKIESNDKNLEDRQQDDATVLSIYLPIF